MKLTSLVLILILVGIGVLYAEDVISNRPVDVGEKVRSSADIENRPIHFPSRNLGSNQSSADGKTNGTSSVFITTVGALLLVILLIVLLTWIFRKASPVNKIFLRTLPMIKVLGKTYITPRQYLVLVKFDKYLFLLGVSDNNINPIFTITDPQEASRLLSLVEQYNPSGITSSFKKLFTSEAEELTKAELPEETLPDTSNPSDKKSEEKKVLDLKNEINVLLNKIEELKGKGCL